MNRARSSVAAAVVATAALLLCGCSSAASPADVHLPEKNSAQWVMPLDQYVPVDGDLADYAENLLVQPCMEKAGYSWDVPWRDTTTTEKSATANAVGRRLFTTAIAAELGYHDDVRKSADAQAWAEFSASKVDIPDAEEQTLTKCIYAVREKLPRLDGQDQLASSYGQAAFEKAKRAEPVAAAEGRWRSCMADEGVSDLPTDPLDMPTESMLVDLSIDPSAPPSAEEIRVATKDAKCRESSGFSKTLYAEEWKEQVTLLEQNADALERIKTKIAKNRAAVLAAITSNAPRG